MRLLKKINRSYLISSAVVLVIGLLAFYFLINRIASREIIEGLHASKARIVHELGQHKTVLRLYPLIEVEETQKTGSEFMKDTTIFDPIEGENEVFKELNTFREINGKLYHITIRAIAVEKEDIVMSIFLSIMAIFLLLIGVLYFINKSATSTVWRPFYQNLTILKNFSLEENREISLQKTGITEFDELNEVITKLTEKVSTDYLNLKEFTENASHEIQTPLSVILLNLEEVLQQNLPEAELTKIYHTYEAAKRLSTLNQHLLLLTKIENGQFVAEKLFLNKVIQNRLKALSPLIDSASLRVRLERQGDFPVKMHEALAETLVNNLLSNAIKHNNEGGSIRINISGNGFEICNTGKGKPLSGNEIFNRFVKKDSQGLGLGLAIVKRICDTHKLEISYAYLEKMHCFRITYRS
ncbi:MAG: two-component sensor histidine kinase [bacterium]|nr:MAG: two-component sensor histidine kinase [bacterium]